MTSTTVSPELFRPDMGDVFSLEKSRAIMSHSQDVFDRMTAGGRLGQREEQGGNYYLDDPVERHNYSLWLGRLTDLRQTSGRASVLIGACGDGLEFELPQLRGFQLNGFDVSPGMINATAARLAELGISANLEVLNVIDLRYQADFPGPFAGVSFAQAAAFIPPTELNDWHFRTALMNLLRRVQPGGFFYFSTTQYPDPIHIRTWQVGEEVFGQTAYFARHPMFVAKTLEDLGLVILHRDYYDSNGVDPAQTYVNYYIIGCKT